MHHFCIYILSTVCKTDGPGVFSSMGLLSVSFQVSPSQTSMPLQLPMHPFYITETSLHLYDNAR